MVLVTTANGEREIEGISYDRLKEDMRDTNRELKKKLETVDVLGTGEVPAEGETAEGSGNAPAAAMKPEGLLSDSQVWSNTDGKEITAAVKSVAAGTVVFVINGNEVPYPLSNLSPESRAAIESLAAE